MKLKVKWWIGLSVISLILLVYAAYYINISNAPHPPTFAITGFPLIAQPNDITCGPTSATMLLRFYNRNVGVEEVAAKAHTTFFKYKGKPIGGTFPIQEKEALEACGLNVKMINGTLDVLKYYVSQKRPCVVLIRSGERLMHWVVVIGYDEANVTIADPGSGESYNMVNKTFLNAWNFTGDMDGTFYGKDIYHFFIVVGEENSNTILVPDYPPT